MMPRCRQRWGDLATGRLSRGAPWAGAARRDACGTSSASSRRVALLRKLIALGWFCGVALYLSLASAAPAVSAQETAKADKGTETEEKVAPDSPRAAMAEFRHRVRAGDYAGAARYLDVAPGEAADGPTLAQHLKEVLNRRLWLDLSKISPESHGNTADNQPPNSEELGTIRAASGKPEPVLLVRKSYAPGSHWVFSRSTVSRIDDWYEHLESVWLSERLPKPLLKMGPKLLRWWQWIALVPLVGIAWALSFALTRIGKVAARHSLPEQVGTLQELRRPLTLALTLGLSYAALPWLGLYQPAEQMLHRWGSALLFVALFWALWRGVELSRHSASTSRWARESVSAGSLLSLGARLAKFAVAVAAFMVVLSQLGYQATTILTGLGIGGVALALAAQKTVENLFGTFSLAIDQPFREGDYVKVDGIEGTVESVGLRSTRIRTPDRTLISIPNGRLADMRIETVSRQDRLRFYNVIGISPANANRLPDLLERIRALLAAEPLVTKESIGARFIGLTDSALNVEVVAMLATVEAGRFVEARERLLLGILRVVGEAGCGLARPARSVELVSTPGQPPNSGQSRPAAE